MRDRQLWLLRRSTELAAAAAKVEEQEGDYKDKPVITARLKPHRKSQRARTYKALLWWAQVGLHLQGTTLLGHHAVRASHC